MSDHVPDAPEAPEGMPGDEHWFDGPIRGFQPKDDLNGEPPDLDDTDSGTAPAPR